MNADKNYSDLLRKTQAYERDLSRAVKSVERFRDDNRVLRETCETLRSSQTSHAQKWESAKQQIARSAKQTEEYKVERDQAVLQHQKQLIERDQNVEKLNRKISQLSNEVQHKRICLIEEIEAPLIERIATTEAEFQRVQKKYADHQQMTQTQLFERDDYKEQKEKELSQLKKKLEQDVMSHASTVRQLTLKLQEKENLESTNCQLMREVEEFKIQSEQMKREIEDLIQNSSKKLKAKLSMIDRQSEEFVIAQKEAQRYRIECERLERTTARTQSELEEAEEAKLLAVKSLEQRQLEWVEKHHCLEEKHKRETQRFTRELEHQKGSVATEMEGLQNVVKNLKTDIELKETQLRDLRLKVDTLELEKSEELQALRDHSEGDMASVNSSHINICASLEEEKQALLAERADLVEKLEELKMEAQDALDSSDKSNSKSNALLQHVRQTEQDCASRLHEYEALQQDYKILQKDHRELMTRFDQLQKSYNNLDESTRHDKEEARSLGMQLEQERRSRDEFVEALKLKREREEVRLQQEFENLTRLKDEQAMELTRVKTLAKQQVGKIENRATELKIQSQLLAQKVQQLQAEKENLISTMQHAKVMQDDWNRTDNIFGLPSNMTATSGNAIEELSHALQLSTIAKTAERDDMHIPYYTTRPNGAALYDRTAMSHATAHRKSLEKLLTEQSSTLVLPDTSMALTKKNGNESS